MDTSRWLFVVLLGAISVGLVLFSGWLVREDRSQARLEIIEQCRQNCLAVHPEWTAEECQLICANRIWVGMTTEQARASWGNPSLIERSATESGESQKWEYGGLGWLYFEDGLLVDYEE